MARKPTGKAVSRTGGRSIHPGTVGRKPASRQRKAVVKKKPHRPRGEAERIFDRRVKVFELRLQGKSFPQIAKEVGCGVKTAWDDVQCELETRLEQLGDKVGSLRQQEVERCFHIISFMSPKLKKGSDKAANAILRASARIAMLLGLDAPTKIAPTDPSGLKPYAVDLNALPADALVKAREAAALAQQTKTEPTE